jgi:predicted polyphosphate/ATP-dependent NAD kinase
VEEAMTEKALVDFCAAAVAAAITVSIWGVVIFSVERNNKIHKDVLGRVKRRKRIVKIDHD